MSIRLVITSREAREKAGTVKSKEELRKKIENDIRDWIKKGNEISHYDNVGNKISST